MSVQITLIGEYNAGETKLEAIDLATGKPVTIKNFHEKSKDKWHIVLAANSANRKYISHNEFNTKMNKDTNTYIVEDKTAAPRVLGTSNPDAKLVPYMTEEDKKVYDEIMKRAEENGPQELSEEEELEKEINRLKARLEAKQTGVEYVEDKPKKRSKIDQILDEDAEMYKAIIERAAEAKQNAPKAERKPRGPLTEEQKIKMDENKLSKLQAKLAAMRASQTKQA